jgi:hypothetical protein
MYQRIVAVEDLNLGIVLLKRREVGIVEPEIGTRSPNVGDELTRMTAMEVADGGRQHDDVAGRLEVPEDELSGHRAL